MKEKLAQLTMSIVVLIAVPAFALDRKQEVYVGTQGGVNAGVATTSMQHLNGTTRLLGYTIDDASANPPDGFVEVFVGTEANVNAGVVSPSNNHNNGSTESIGYVSKRPIKGGVKVYVGTQDGCNAGVVTNSIGHLKCSTKFLGYLLPQKARN